MNAKRPTLWPSILAGACAGALVVVVYGWFNAQNEVVPEQNTSVSTTRLNSRSADNATDTADAENQRRLARLEQQLSALANAASTRNARDIASDTDQGTLVGEPDPMAAPDSEKPVSPEEAKRMAIAAWEQTQANFLREPVDPAWALNTSEMFRADVGALAHGQGFSVIQSECRTTHCTVMVEWPSFEDAVDGFKTLLHHNYQANCARETLLPDPDPATAGSPYQASIIFDCSEWRQQREFETAWR